MTQEFTLIIEKDAPLPDGQTRGGVHAKHKEKLMSMEIGDSFFLENVTKEEIANLIRYAKRLGVHLLARDTDEDDYYMAPGVRAWRVEQEDLPGRKPNKLHKSIFDEDNSKQTRESILRAFDDGQIGLSKRDELLAEHNYDGPEMRFWYHEKDRLVMVANLPETVGNGFVEIPKAKYDSLLAVGDAFESRPKKSTGKPEGDAFDHRTYYYHEESESVWMLEVGEKYPQNADAAVSVPISQEAYEAFVFVEKCLEQRNEPCRLYVKKSLCYAAIQPISRHEELIENGWKPVGAASFCQALIDWYDAPSYWRNPETGLILQKLPGWVENKTLHYDDWEEVSEAEYSAESLAGQPDYDTYWRRADGSCTVVPPEKFEKARKTKGAVQISERVYRRWEKTQNDDEL